MGTVMQPLAEASNSLPRWSAIRTRAHVYTHNRTRVCAFFRGGSVLSHDGGPPGHSPALASMTAERIGPQWASILQGLTASRSSIVHAAEFALARGVRGLVGELRRGGLGVDEARLEGQGPFFRLGDVADRRGLARRRRGHLPRGRLAAPLGVGGVLERFTGHRLWCCYDGI